MNVLSSATGRALGGMVSKFKMLGNMGFKTYTTMFESSVERCYCMQQGFGVPGHWMHWKVQNRARHFFRGVNRFWPMVGL